MYALTWLEQWWATTDDDETEVLTQPKVLVAHTREEEIVVEPV
jgi:hypothetical protein